MRNSLFNFFDRFRAGLIGDAKKQPRYSDDIQLVSVVQDVSGVGGGGGGFVPGFQAPDPIHIEYCTMVSTPAVAGQFGRMELICSAAGGGLWVSALIGTTATNVNGRIFTIAAPSGLFTRLLPDQTNATAFGAGLPATAIVDSGNTVFLPPNTFWRTNSGTSTDQHGGPSALQDPVYVAPGRVFVFQMSNALLAGFFGVYWREIP